MRASFHACTGCRATQGKMLPFGIKQCVCWRAHTALQHVERVLLGLSGLAQQHVQNLPTAALQNSSSLNSCACMQVVKVTIVHAHIQPWSFSCHALSVITGSLEAAGASKIGVPRRTAAQARSSSVHSVILPNKEVKSCSCCSWVASALLHCLLPSCFYWQAASLAVV